MYGGCVTRPSISADSADGSRHEALLAQLAVGPQRRDDVSHLRSTHTPPIPLAHYCIDAPAGGQRVAVDLFSGLQGGRLPGIMALNHNPGNRGRGGYADFCRHHLKPTLPCEYTIGPRWMSHGSLSRVSRLHTAPGDAEEHAVIGDSVIKEVSPSPSSSRFSVDLLTSRCCHPIASSAAPANSPSPFHPVACAPELRPRNAAGSP